MTGPDTLRSAPALEGPALDALGALLTAAEQADGAPPLNDAGRLNLRRSRPEVVHLWLERAGAVVGYAQLEDAPTGSTGQVVVAPTARRTGVGSALLAALRAHAAGPLHVWAVGDTPAAAALARRGGLVAVRTLLVMTRPLVDLPPVRVPAGVVIDTFRPGVDGPAWLAVNRRAFAAHPEQGSMGPEDLALRMAEPWFEAAGFFLARSAADPGGPLLGFHWTKRHGDGLGEVYVIGVDPDAQGRGLAKALLATGLASLRDRGDDTVELYVEADAPRAVGLYDAHGFVVSSRDVMYGEPVTAGP